MARLCQALLLLTITVTLESSTVQAWGSPKVVRPFQDISSSYVYVQQAVWYAKKEYNKANKDKYSFRVVEILKSQEQEVFCIFIVRSKPWKFELSMLKKQCKDA
ncbi:cystatin-13-like isoform X2 [Heterocephalus glaber]|uniref:Cystatin-13-like isoform X2 n=1 Tax=Heterocephalus glaber TaxID=10181 RepID=A0AAX6SNK9_HETGA|nr:cystatin-13-like isoform X2 [Heterocephalus glaber]